MTISFRCEHCGKRVEAPDSAGGRRGKCPYCKQSNYIPSPVSDDELIELAPEDDAGARGDEDESVRETERALIAEMTARDVLPVPPEKEERAELEDNLRPAVVGYCLAMADSKLERAQKHLSELKEAGEVAREVVDEFISGTVLEPALDTIPPKILQGFLTNLRKELG